jgi:hypothetical protein
MIGTDKILDVILEIYGILIGLFFAIFHKKLGEIAVERWHKVFPKIKIWEEGYYIFFLLFGIGAVIFCLLHLLGINK